VDNISITMVVRMKITKKRKKAWLYEANYLDQRKTYGIHRKHVYLELRD
jgi:hypothetical protein